MNKTLIKFWFLRIYQLSCLPPFFVMLGYMIYVNMTHIESYWINVGIYCGLFLGIWIHSQFLYARWEKEFETYDKIHSQTGVE